MMDGQVDISHKCQKEEETNNIKSNVNSFKREKSYEEETDVEERKKKDLCNNIKRYSRYELLSLRNGELSMDYPHCALRSDLQLLSIWTCRLRCELQYLGLWKIPNTSNLSGNCSCIGNCPSYACGDVNDQAHASSSSQVNIGGSQICFGNTQQSHKSHSQITNLSPSLGSKRAVRSRERSINYQRCINLDLIRSTTPNGSGVEGPLHLNHLTKTSFMDHRSISSSHLMPAFAKRRMGHTNCFHNQGEICSNFSNNVGQNTDHLSNDEVNENLNQFEPLKPRRESLKLSNNQNLHHVYKTPGNNSRPYKSDQFTDNQTGWMNMVKRINPEYTPSLHKVNNATGVNKKLIFERRIGSGRLVPRDVNWDIRCIKQIEKDNYSTSNINNNNTEKYNTSDEVDKIYHRNSTSTRYSDGRSQENRLYDRRISTSDDSKSNGSTCKRYTASSLGDERDNDANSNCHYHIHTPHFTGQRSMSFRRREYVEHREHRDLRESKDVRENRESKDQRSDQYHRDSKEEPEWFSEGPTSQHDTIELRGFEEIDDTHQQHQKPSVSKYAEIEKKSSQTSLLSHSSCSNINLSANERSDISGGMLNNSTANIFNRYNDNDNDCNKNNDLTTPKKEIGNVDKIIDNKENISKLQEDENSDKNGKEFIFDSFLNIEALENTLINVVSDETMPANDGGTSRFSRWFFNNSSSNQHNDGEHSKNLPTEDDSKQINNEFNKNEFSSFLTFLKSNNFPARELSKSLPSNVSALSVEELEARMRKTDVGGGEANKGSDQGLSKSEVDRSDRIESENQLSATSQTADIDSQDVESFRKLLDQLGKPRVDISMNIILPNTTGHSHSLPNSVGVLSPGISPVPFIGNMTKQDYMLKMMHHQQQQQILLHQQNISKVSLPPQHHKMLEMHQRSENVPLMTIPSHPYLISTILNQPQKRQDVQHLVQCVAREELSQSFLENELKNPNVPQCTKEIISTVLKETSMLKSNQNNFAKPLDSGKPGTVSDVENGSAPTNLIQSLVKGEVSLNHLDNELNKLNNMAVITDSNGGLAKEKSRCATPSATPLTIDPISRSGNIIVPMPPQVVPVQQNQHPIIASESASNTTEQQRLISSETQSHHQEDPLLRIASQRELQAQTVMQTALFNKKMEADQHEVLRRHQEMYKQHQHELETHGINQQNQQSSKSSMNQQTSQRINSPTPLAFTPTSVLRKMTAEKDTASVSTQTKILPSSSAEQLQPNVKVPIHQQICNQQISYQHTNQPRMILGGNFQYMHEHQYHIPTPLHGSPQISPQQKSQIRGQPPGTIKWPVISNSCMISNHSLLNNMNKPMGRPILKGPGPIPSTVSQNSLNPQCQNQLNINKHSQSIQAISQMQKFSSMSQPRQIVGQQFSTHIIQHQIPTSQQNNMQQQQQKLFQQQQQHHHHQQQQQQQREQQQLQEGSIVMRRHQIPQTNLASHASLPPSTNPPVNNDNNTVTSINYQREGVLSPTSNQLAQWFSPELLAQASAGKLPLLNMNQALSLEEFERSIQHSSTAVHN